MARKLIYTCDYDQKEVSGKKHISLHFHGDSGIAVPPETEGEQFIIVRDGVGNRMLQFCNGQCLARYFAKLIKSASRIPF